MVNASRAWKYAQPRCMTFLRWQTNVSMESTVSTSIRSSHSPRGHSLRLAGSPVAAWQAVSLRTIEEAKEPRALGEPWEQHPIVAGQPAIERPIAPAFESMEQPQSDHFTGPEV